MPGGPGRGARGRTEFLIARLINRAYSNGMARPSRHVDRDLLQAGRAMYEAGGSAGLTVRGVAERAGVNAAMVHYHFGSRESFVRAVLQSVYDGMFADLALAADHAGHGTVERLRDAVRVLARFVRDHRRLLRHLVRETLEGEPVVVAFARANLPRHLGVIGALVAQGQRERVLRSVPPAQALAFLAGAVGAPILAGAAMAASGLIPASLAASFDETVLSDAALDERIDIALAGLARPGRR